MSASPRLRRAVVAQGVGALLLLTPGTALADAPEQQGWWTTTNPGAPAPPGGPAPADVPPDGLLVQPGAQAPTAYAALLYPLPPGASADTLTLAVAPGSGTPPGAKLAVCPLVEPQFEPAQGGPIADAPAYGCARTLVATLDTARSTFVFKLSELALRGEVGLALVPGDTTSRVVLAKPAEDSLTLDGSSLDGGTTTPPASSFDGGTASSEGSSTPAFDTEGPSSPGLSAALAGPPVAATEKPNVAPPAAPPAPTGANQLLPTASAAPPTGSGVKRYLVGLLAMGAALAALLWAFAGGGPTSAPPSTAGRGQSGHQPE